MSVDNDERKLRRDLLLKVYDAAIAEYRFNVQLNWDRAKFYLGLAVSALAAGTALIKLAPDNGATSFLLMMYFFIVAGVTLFGSQAVAKGKEYTRQAVLTKTLIERELELFKALEPFSDPQLHLGIAVTPGQRDFLAVIFSRHKREGKRPDKGSILDRTQLIFIALIAISILFGIMTWVNLILSAAKAVS